MRQMLIIFLAVLCTHAQSRQIKPLGSGGKRVALVVGNDLYRTIAALTTVVASGARRIFPLGLSW